MRTPNTVIEDARVLTADFLPNRMVHRNSQLNEIKRCLEPILDGKNPRNMLLYGPPGTGKSTMAEYVVDELQKHSSTVVWGSVNCWRYPSRFKVYYNLLQDIGVNLIHRTGTPTDELVDKFREKVSGRPSIVILDEVDQIEEERILYDFARENNIGLIMIANKETALYDVDQRIRSSLEGTKEVRFPAYPQEELVDILKDRRKWGLRKEAVDNQQLNRIASRADGDARVAINGLRIAAEEAENRDMEEITDAIVENALPQAEEENKSKSVDKLNGHQEVLYEIIKEEGEISPGELYEEYEEKVDDPKTERTRRKYLKKMDHYRLIESEGEGRWRKYRLQE
ncbi:MAG: orc1/cdc6 family replication initiation protein [Nanohaloarchaea archaeon]|nr:orc1/cdc6 family replication initiation protein [Candidatus Nanohaloarchaea archaeon]